MACKIIADDEKNSPVQTIDFSKVETFQPGSPSWLSICCKVRSALEENGCFVVSCDELSSKLTDDVFSQSKDLFALPTETKVKNKSNEPYRGYIGQDPRIPLYEGLAIDNVTESGVAQKFMDLMWPQGKENFCESVHAYATLLASLNHTIVQMLFESYGAGKHYPKMAAINGHLLRFLRYRDPRETESDTRLAAHTDLNFATFVHQHNLGGLEIETNDGNWIGLEVADSQILFMAGDTMKAWSNDRIKACRHRVKLSAGNGARYSLGLFTWNNGVIEVPKELVDEEHPLAYKPFDPRDFVRFYCTSPDAKKHLNPLKAYCGVIDS